MPAIDGLIKGARVNFGIPQSEYILRVDAETGEAVSCYNQDTDTEYIGGGSDYEVITVTVRAANISPQGDYTGLFSDELEVNGCDIDTTKPVTTFVTVDGIGQLPIVGRNGKAYIGNSFHRGWFPTEEELADVTGLPDSFIINGVTFLTDEFLIEVTEGAELVALIDPLI